MEKRKIEDILLDQYEKNYYSLSRAAYRIVGDSTAAFDIIQDAFVRLLTRPEVLVPIKNLQAYLFCCVHNESLNYLKRCKRQVSLEDDLLEQKITKRYLRMSYPEEFLGEDIEDLKEMLHVTLPDYPQEIIEAYVDYVVSGYSLKELADRVGKKPNTLSQQFRRIKTKLATIVHLFTIIYSIICMTSSHI